VLPTGFTNHVNEEGIAFYNALIDELLAHNITPIATLYHWDLPLALQTEFDGLLGGKVVVDAFASYARLCFSRFGDRVKSWITLNEPWCSSILGYGSGEMAPGRKHKCKTETYIAGTSYLLCYPFLHFYIIRISFSSPYFAAVSCSCCQGVPFGI
jgi:beta-glucosidase/6-phospho-beta-glucosidase/beta-galactosidase